MIPADLRELNQWVSWRYETRKGKITKVPVSPITGRRASTTDSSTWGSYRQALGVITGEGIGFVFSPDDGLAGVDMDACVSARGTVHDAAYEIVRSLNGYVEFSPSGNGLHIIVRGRLERGRHTLKTEWRNEIAFYDRGRFFTIGSDGRGEIREAQAELDALIAYYFPEPELAPPVTHPRPSYGDDTAVLDRVHADRRIALLWAGDCSMQGGDHSAADLALCAHLAFFTGNDADRIDSLFRRSGLMREKWLEPRGETTYGRQTIDRALRGRT